jgi:hypothetical protein
MATIPSTSAAGLMAGGQERSMAAGTHPETDLATVPQLHPATANGYGYGYGDGDGDGYGYGYGDGDGDGYGYGDGDGYDYGYGG